MSEIIQAQKTARPVVLRILRYHLDDVDDVLQDAAVQALKHSDEFRGKSRYSTWFTKIAINTALMHLRRRVVKNADKMWPLKDLDLLSTEETPEQFVAREERERLIRIRLHKAIRLLKPALRMETWRWLRGERAINGAEKATRHRARVKLRKMLLV
jgi:RNA polymerase sigma-70 factor (ECF subfamily)